MDFLNEVEKKLDLPSAEKKQVMRELESHYHEVEGELLASGMNECEAAREAARRLGDPQDIAQRMQAVHYRASWKSALVSIIPILGWVFWFAWKYPGSGQIVHAMNSTGHYLFTLSWIVIVGISIRELIARRRPVWLATWLASVLVMGYPLLFRRWIYAFISPTDSPLIPLILIFAGPMLTAIFVFARQRYGNYAQTSLFMLVFYTSILLLMPFPNMSGTLDLPNGGTSRFASSPSLFAIFLVLTTLFEAAAVLAYTRATSRERRLAVTFAGTLAVWMSTLVGQIIASSTYQMPSELSSKLPVFLVSCVGYSAIQTLWIIGIPALFERFGRNRQTRIAQ